MNLGFAEFVLLTIDVFSFGLIAFLVVISMAESRMTKRLPDSTDSAGCYRLAIALILGTNVGLWLARLALLYR